MTVEIYWLTITALMTSLIWMPYMIDRMNTRGIMGAFGNPGPDTPPQSDWAQRSMAAHRNANENLVLFAIAVFALQLTSTGNEMTATAALVFFWARLAHFFLHTLGVPVLRSVAFITGWMCFLYMALVALGMV